MGPVLFNILISDLNGGAGCSISRSADNTKQGGVADSPTGSCTAIQREMRTHWKESSEGPQNDRLEHLCCEESLRELGLQPGGEGSGGSYQCS